MKKGMLLGISLAVAAVGVLLMNRGGAGNMLGFLKSGDQDSDTGPSGSAGPVDRKQVSTAPTSRPSAPKPGVAPITKTKTGTAGVVQAPTVRTPTVKAKPSPGGAVKVAAKPSSAAKAPATRATVPASPSAVGTNFRTAADVRLSYSGLPARMVQ